MLCKNPYMIGIKPHGCGQCMPCRLSKRREWTHRMMLEAAKSSSSAFVTLTYDDEHLPKDGSLNPRDLQLFIKKLRERVDFRFRFYAVGEYGDQTSRPHYHIGLFGFPVCNFLRTQHLRQKCCDVCHLIKSVWGMGGIDVGSLEKDSAQYLAGYITKKLTKPDDPLLNGRYPEFARMSRKPGIGHAAVEDINDAISDLNLDTVPSVLNHGGKEWPLGRYLKEKLRERLNIPKPDTRNCSIRTAIKTETRSEFFLRVHELQENYRQKKKGVSPKKVITETFKQKNVDLEAKQKIYRRFRNV